MANLSATPTETILVVDDDREILRNAEDMLRAMGYTVIGTGDPRAALRFARLAGSIHLLLTDVVMPLMSGGQLAHEFRQIRPNAKVLFMSRHAVEAVETYHVKLAPGEPYLKKPFTIADLQNTVKAALAYRPPAWPRARSSMTV